MRVALIGGSGGLGRVLSPLLSDSGHDPVVFGRRSDPPVDLATGEGLPAALSGADVVVHLASDPRRSNEIDIAGTQRILGSLDGQHLVYMSIVGVDRHPFSYYKAKFRAEQMITDAGKPFTILRATQFHSFIEFILSALCRRWLAPVPSGFVTQPIDVGEVAKELARLIDQRPVGLQPEMAGPEVLGVSHLARSYMEARGREAPLLPIPVPGAAGAAFRNGLHTNPERAVGVKTWAQHLDERFPPG